MQGETNQSLSSLEIIDRSSKYIAGGVVSLNRKVSPGIVFDSAEGSKLYDVDGREYIDYHAAFAPYLLGHNFPYVNDAAIKSLSDGWSLMGSGTNYWEATLSQMLCESVPSLELVQITNTGSEATAHAIRLSRAYTGRDHIILPLGGYNGWHNEVARKVMTTIDEIGPRVSPGEYPFMAMSGGIPEDTKKVVHIVNFNDLGSVEYVMKKYPIACVMTEPVLQNVGIVSPNPGYLKGLIELCERHGSLCVFDEVKTGFRTGLGGYQEYCGVKPHLSVFGKAVANGFPLGVIGGKRGIMELFNDPDDKKRVLIAGTYNAHPVNTAAAIATIEFLRRDGVYESIDKSSHLLYDGLKMLFDEKGIASTLANNKSAFCAYFCNEAPQDLHDVLKNHNFQLDLTYRQELIKRGVYHIPIPCKQGSVSYSHTEEDINKTLEITREVLKVI
ncbi:MAG: aspartate aminotransferase family protein [Saprospiraceae bacterium]|nr:aspartate aminotransferase family protein [Saprospiraceae bacterium]